jgi:excisionase family DNA binding protein
MNWQSINPLNLPSIAIDRRYALPRVSSVYFVIEADSQIVYIGQAVNLRSRWAAGHHRLDDCKPTARIAWIEIEDAAMRSGAEYSLICRYRPHLNSNDNPQLLLPPSPFETFDKVAFSEEETYLTTKETAGRLGISVVRVQQLIKTGRIPASRFGGSWAICERDLVTLRERKPGRPRKDTNNK